MGQQGCVCERGTEHIEGVPYQGRPGRGILYPLGWLIALSSGDIVSPLISMTLLTGSVSQGSPGTASAVLFLGKLQRTLQRTRTQVESLGGVGLGSGVLVGVPEVEDDIQNGGKGGVGAQSPCLECRTCCRKMERMLVARSLAWR